MRGTVFGSVPFCWRMATIGIGSHAWVLCLGKMRVVINFRDFATTLAILLLSLSLPSCLASPLRIFWNLRRSWFHPQFWTGHRVDRGYSSFILSLLLARCFQTMRSANKIMTVRYNDRLGRLILVAIHLKDQAVRNFAVASLDRTIKQ